MGIDSKQFYDEIITPALDLMGRVIHPDMNSSPARKIILNTLSAESQLKYIKQIGNGPARGLCQMEEPTFNDHIAYCERKGTDFRNKVIFCIYNRMYREMPKFEELTWNLRMQVVLVRLHYWRIPEPIPTATPLQARYWKKYYNTEQGKGTVQHYINSIPV